MSTQARVTRVTESLCGRGVAWRGPDQAKHERQGAWSARLAGSARGTSAAVAVQCVWGARVAWLAAAAQRLFRGWVRVPELAAHVGSTLAARPGSPLASLPPCAGSCSIIV